MSLKSARKPVSAAFIAVALALAAIPAAAPAQTSTLALPKADLVLVDKAQTYLQHLTQAQGRFTQINPRGSVSTGALYLKRPGKARFTYDPPSGLLVVADGKSVSVWDSRLETFDQAPLYATPLGILLGRYIRLDQDVVVSRVDRFADGFALTARNLTAREHADGYITLVFGDNPMVLRGWTVVDGQGQATKVTISELHAAALDPALFVLKDPRHAGPSR
jgi:outer membrane lipoprotein-sorting protein